MLIIKYRYTEQKKLQNGSTHDLAISRSTMSLINLKKGKVLFWHSYLMVEETVQNKHKHRYLSLHPRHTKVIIVICISAKTKLFIIKCKTSA